MTLTGFIDLIFFLLFFFPSLSISLVIHIKPLGGTLPNFGKVPPNGSPKPSCPELTHEYKKVGIRSSIREN